MSTKIASSYEIRTDHGVLIVAIHLEALVKESNLHELQEDIFEQLDQVQHAVLIDCHRLIGKASTSLLATLVSVRREASRFALPLAVCSLKGPMREAFEISCLDRIIPTYSTQTAAMVSLGQFEAFERAELEPQSKAEEPTEPEEEVSPTDSGAFADRLSSLANIDPQLQLMLAGGVAIVVIAVVGLLGWQLFGSSDNRTERPNVSPEPSTLQVPENGALLTGTVMSPEGYESQSMVIAWPDKEYEQKVSPSVVKQHINSGQVGMAAPEIYTAITLADGSFQMKLGEPGMYNFLAISPEDKGNSRIYGDNETKLEGRFTNAREMLGRNKYVLTYRMVGKEDHFDIRIVTE